MGGKPPAVSASLLDASKGAHYEIHSRIIDWRRLGFRVVLYHGASNTEFRKAAAEIPALAA